MDGLLRSIAGSVGNLFAGMWHAAGDALGGVVHAANNTLPGGIFSVVAAAIVLLLVWNVARR